MTLQDLIAEITAVNDLKTAEMAVSGQAASDAAACVALDQQAAASKLAAECAVANTLAALDQLIKDEQAFFLAVAPEPAVLARLSQLRR